MARHRVNKSHSAGKFRGQVRKTHRKNMIGPKRGGIRL